MFLSGPVERLLDHFGLTADPSSVRACGNGILFRFHKPELAGRILENSVMFAKGGLGILHGRHVGGVVIEYRSYTDGIGCSLHVVLGKTGATFADIDRFNPYQGARHLLLHGILELCPYLLRGAHRRTLALVTNGSQGATANALQTPQPGAFHNGDCPRVSGGVCDCRAVGEPVRSRR